MYGYIQVCKPELKFREFDEYRAYYCGLCRTLREKFGASSQMLLSYDLTFLSLLLDSLYEPENESFKSRCIAHPVNEQKFIVSEITDYTADMCMLLASYKFEDDWKDERKYLKKALGKIFSGRYESVRERYTDKAIVIDDEIEKLDRLERENCNNPEEPASCFGRILAEIMAYRNDLWENTLREIGFHMGKFIYLSDAFDDLSKDRKKKCYNPFSSQDEHDPDFHKAAEDLLRLMIAPAASAFEYLPIVKNAEILRNIIYAGVWTGFRRRKSHYLSQGEKAKQGGNI